ncbi:hypothetical protein M4D56_22890 [Cytobacillus oceanisediminis]|uniref:hypothetical protein n=1 Tax=Cytobacillus TaxID=2675230 RepID=UPI00203EE9CB|nr:MULTISPECIES: hypothetical protein [Cytobacillus]MBY0156842.1 hypothetical protein [Cytobacillus firmus]MCM3391277.1 hypothetical protein [Cytobacillus oceanisediminis]MCM3531936.1 hypothetical protein [Cytobacillus oceanisediminis]UQX52879.1 hypothetical protein M5V91_18310 [Cytobacillus pseudoceanisediminis]
MSLLLHSLYLIINNENAPTTKEDKSTLIISALDADHNEFDLFFCIFMDAGGKMLSKQIANKDLEQYRYAITKRTLEEIVAELFYFKI